MRTAALILTLTACGNPELEAENASLKDEVSKLEAENKKLDRASEKLQTKLRKAKKASAELQAAEVYGKLGIEKGEKLGSVFHTSMGDITCELMPAVAPVTVLNFVGLAEGTKGWTDPKTKKKMTTPLYSGTVFHRVIPKFMIQGGDPLGSGRGGPGYKFKDETTSDVTFDQPGLLAMANSGPSTNGSQFFITDRSNPDHLNGKHTIFGKCGNLDVVESIATVSANRSNKPDVDVVIRSIEITR
jgi:peptidyl-prolyl cis-trans isomerase A (cyclophilin A)